MNADRIIEIHDDLHAKSRKLMLDKNHDYAGVNNDALSNFKGAAQELGLNVLEVWGVHFYKQVSALMSLVRKGSLKAESVESRILDIRNYTALLAALIEDGDEERNAVYLDDVEPEIDFDSVKQCMYCHSTYIGLKDGGRTKYCADCRNEIAWKEPIQCNKCKSTSIKGGQCQVCGSSVLCQNPTTEVTTEVTTKEYIDVLDNLLDVHGGSNRVDADEVRFRCLHGLHKDITVSDIIKAVDEWKHSSHLACTPKKWIEDISTALEQGVWKIIGVRIKPFTEPHESRIAGLYNTKKQREVTTEVDDEEPMQCHVCKSTNIVAYPTVEPFQFVVCKTCGAVLHDKKDKTCQT